MTRLTESLARFISDPRLQTIPAEAARIVRTGFIDTIATMLAGRDEPVVRIVRGFVAARQAGVRETFPALRHRVFANGSANHTHE